MSLVLVPWHFHSVLRSHLVDSSVHHFVRQSDPTRTSPYCIGVVMRVNDSLWFETLLTTVGRNPKCRVGDDDEIQYHKAARILSWKCGRSHVCLCHRDSFCIRGLPLVAPREKRHLTYKVDYLWRCVQVWLRCYPHALLMKWKLMRSRKTPGFKILLMM